MSELKVDKITPRLGTTLTLGDSGDTINFGSGVLPNFENLTVTGDLTVDTNSLKVDSTNNFVGIGTASPSVALDVVGAITATGNITGTLATASQPNITSVGTLSSLSVSGNITGTLATASQPNITSLGTLSSATISGDLTVDTNTLYVDSTNNRVGIGTTSPTVALDVVGRIQIDEPSGNGTFIIDGSATSSSQIRFSQDGTPKGYVTYWDSSDTLGLTDGSANGLHFKPSTGRVGIGTNSPERTLHLQSAAPEIMMKDSDNNTYITMLSNDGILSFGRNGSESMRINSSGNLSVGTTLNFGVLTLGQGTVTSNVGQFNLYDTTSGGGANTGGSIAFMGSDGVSDRGYAVIRGLKQNSTAGNYSGYLSFLTRNNGASVAEGMRIHPEGYTELFSSDSYNQLVLTPSGTNAPATINFNTPGTGRARFRVQGNEYMTILSTGKVGIGTSNPSRNLYVHGDDTSTGGNVLGVRNNNSTAGAFVNFIAGGANAPSIGAKGNDIVFTSDGYSGTEFLRILGSNGNVGIGTASPVAKLEVNGNIHLADNNRIQLGNDSDLILRHNGTNSEINDQGTGDLLIGTSGNKIRLWNQATTQIFAEFNNLGAVELRHNGSTKFATTASGATVTGTLTSDGLALGDNETIDFGASADLQIYHSGTHSFITDSGTGNLYIRGGNSINIQDPAGASFIICNDLGTGGDVKLYHLNSQKLTTTSTGIDVTGAITVNGSALSANPSIYAVYNGSTQSTTHSSGVSSITRTGSEQYTLNMSSTLSSSRPLISFTGDGGTDKNTRGNAINVINTTSTTALSFYGENRLGGFQGDLVYVSVVVWDV